MLCPRVHFKCIIVDVVKAYFGSANLTGAGMGAKSEKKRNFENGVLTDDPALVEPLVEQFDSVWRGDFCRENSPAPKASGRPTSVTRSLAKQGRKRPSGRSALGFASAIPSRCSALTSFGGYATSAAIQWRR